MKKIIAAALALVMITSLASCGSKSDSDDDENCIYGQIESVSGNDVVLQIAEYNEKADVSSGDDSDSGSDSSGSRRPKGDFKPEDFDGSMPDGFDPEKFAGKRPSSDDPDNSDSSGSKKRARPEGMPKQGGSKNSKYTLTGEKKEIRIPVGVTVTTSSGVKSSFDALKKGNLIKISYEKDESGSETVKEVQIMEK